MKLKWFWMIYALFALYIVNKALGFITIPASFLGFEKWVLIVVAVLLVLGAYNSYKLNKLAY